MNETWFLLASNLGLVEETKYARKHMHDYK